MGAGSLGKRVYQKLSVLGRIIMLKAAYQKLFFNKIWPAAAGGAVITLFMYAYLHSLGIEEETRNLVLYTFLGMNGLCFLLALYQTGWGILRVLTLRAYLGRLPDLVRDRLEYDFQAGDQTGDLYFTSSHLFVLQLRGGKQWGTVCIPYEEIRQVRLKPNIQNPLILEICRTGNRPSHYVFFQTGISAEKARDIDAKITVLKSRAEPLTPKTEEQRKAEKQEDRKIQRRKTMDTGIFFAAADFAAIMAFCGVIILAENGWKKVRSARSSGLLEWLEPPGGTVTLSAAEMGHLLFWPSLLFYLFLTVVPVLLLAGLIWFMRGRIHRGEGEALEWKSRIQMAVFTVLIVLFILFMGFVYSTDVNLWGRLTEGFRLLTGGA